MENENNILEEMSADVTTDVPDADAQETALVENRCANCQALLEPNQTFCGECGQPVAAQPTLNGEYVQFNPMEEQKKSKKKIILPIILGGVGTLVILAIALFVVFANPQRYIEKGNYETAYKVAASDEKEGIIRENMVAVVSALCVDSLKDPDSFELRDAWVKVTDSDKEIVLKVAANNSYGNTVINYWYYTWDEEDMCFELYDNFADFDEDKMYSWDDYSERLEKLLKNLARSFSELVISDGAQLDTESIDNINTLFGNDILSEVEIISVEPAVTE